MIMDVPWSRTKERGDSGCRSRVRSFQSLRREARPPIDPSSSITPALSGVRSACCTSSHHLPHHLTHHSTSLTANKLAPRLEIYSYWNQGGSENVLSMFLLLGDRYLLPPGIAPAPGEVRETPALGLFHPLAGRYFATPREYMAWYEGEQRRDAASQSAEGAVSAGTRAAAEAGPRGFAPPGSPRVAVLLYRKHVVTRQGYISQMIRWDDACADGAGLGLGESMPE